MSYKSLSTCLKCSLLGLFLLLLQSVFSQQQWRPLNAELEAKQKQLGNDVVFMLWNKDSLLYKKEMGSFFTSKVQAPIAGASQWLTAALVMIFVDEGKISLDDKIGQWLPEFDRYGKSYITLRYCLAHMTGIQDDKGGLKQFTQKRRFASLEEEVNSFARREIRANPSQDFWYGDVGPNIAGRVIEIVSKKRFDAVMKQKLLNPLAMRKTSFTSMDGGALNPSGGAVSTADDYMKFLVMLLNKGQYEGKQILSEESVETLMQLQTQPELIKYAPAMGKGYNYTLGSWALEEKDGKATCLASPGPHGIWPVVDFCRGYACFIIVKKLLDDETSAEPLKLKSMIDEQFPGGCQ